MKGLFLLALGLVAVTAVVGSVTAAAQGMIAPLFAAHRGGALLWPENSLLAFRNALALGADFLELDVHLTRDGEVVVIHDPTLDRTTTGTGPVRARTLAELRTVRLKDRDGTVLEESMPTLDQVVRLAVLGRRQMLLEIKTDERRQRYPGIEEKVFEVLDRQAFTPFTVVMAFEAATWRRLREVRPDARAWPRSTRRACCRPARWGAQLETLRQAGVSFVGLDQALVTAEVAKQARLAGLTLGVWTVNERDGHRPLHRAGRGGGHHRPAGSRQGAARPVSARRFVLALDQGTTGSTALVIDPEGGVRARGYAELPQHYPQPGWVEHDPAQIWATTVQAARPGGEPRPGSRRPRSRRSASPTSARRPSCGSARRAARWATPSCGSAGVPPRSASG